jgi:hypothetical protein
VQCLGLNLVPIRAFAEHADSSQLHNTGTLKASALSRELEVDMQSTHGSPRIQPASKTEGLLSLLRHAMVQHTTGKRDFWYLPHESLLKLVRRENILHALTRINSATEDLQYQDMEGLADNIESQYLKVFTILVLLSKSETIINFMEKAVADKDLPLTLIKDGRVALRKKGEESELRCFEDWADYELKAFSDVQWQIIEPFLAFSNQNELRYHEANDAATVPSYGRKSGRTSVELKSHQRADLMSQFSLDPTAVEEAIGYSASDLLELRHRQDPLMHSRYSVVKALLISWEESNLSQGYREEAAELQTLFQDLRYDTEYYRIPVQDSHMKLHAFIINQCNILSDQRQEQKHETPHLLIIHYGGNGEQFDDRYRDDRSRHRGAMWTE